MRKKRKPEEDEQPDVHHELDGLNLKINNFGELNSSLDVDKINEFLTRHKHDKKLNNIPEDEQLEDTDDSTDDQ